MFDDGALAVSLPARELASIRLPGSIFAASVLAGASFSPQLALAIDLVVGVCRDSGFEPTFVARPEIFTHGESLAWLTARLGGARDHLALSDGSTVRLVPGLRNHVFLFGLDRAADSRALATLERRAPELFGSLHSQINTARRFAGVRDAPTPIGVAGVDTMDREAPLFYRIAINADSADDSVARSLRAKATAGQRFESIEYILLTEACLADPAYMAAIAERLNLVFFDAKRALILRLPPNAESSRDVEARLRAALVALCGASPRVPLAPAASAWFATSDVSVDRLDGLADAFDLLAPESFDFWRHSSGVYRRFRKLRVQAPGPRRDGAAFAHIVEAMTGRPMDSVELRSPGAFPST